MADPESVTKGKTHTQSWELQRSTPPEMSSVEQRAHAEAAWKALPGAAPRSQGAPLDSAACWSAHQLYACPAGKP